MAVGSMLERAGVAGHEGGPVATPPCAGHSDRQSAENKAGQQRKSEKRGYHKRFAAGRGQDGCASLATAPKSCGTVTTDGNSESSRAAHARHIPSETAPAGKSRRRPSHPPHHAQTLTPQPARAAAKISATRAGSVGCSWGAFIGRAMRPTGGCGEAILPAQAMTKKTGFPNDTRL